jgi:hypothetical protein
MFWGTISDNTRRVLAQYVPHLPPKVHALGVGNFTIPTVLRLNGYSGSIGACDVTLYSTALAAYILGKPFDFEFTDAALIAELALDRLESDQERIAALLVLSDRLGYRKQDNLNKVQEWRSMVREFPLLLTKTQARLDVLKAALKLDCYEAIDANIYVEERVGPEDAIIVAPPIGTGDYEREFRLLSEVTSWDKPEYKEMSFADTAFYERLKKLGMPFIVILEKRADGGSLSANPLPSSSRRRWEAA